MNAYRFLEFEKGNIYACSAYSDNYIIKTLVDFDLANHFVNVVGYKLFYLNTNNHVN